MLQSSQISFHRQTKLAQFGSSFSQWRKFRVLSLWRPLSSWALWSSNTIWAWSVWRTVLSHRQKSCVCGPAHSCDFCWYPDFLSVLTCLSGNALQRCFALCQLPTLFLPTETSVLASSFHSSSVLAIQSLGKYPLPRSEPLPLCLQWLKHMH